MFTYFKNLLLRDVNNPNESSGGAITLRICSLIIMAYLLFLSGVLVCLQSASLILCNIFFIAL